MTLFLLFLVIFTVFGAFFGRRQLIRDQKREIQRNKPGHYAIPGFLGYDLYTSPLIPGDKLYILPDINVASFQDFKIEPTYAEFRPFDLKMARLTYELQLQFPPNSAIIVNVT